jgi:hypothetical protein
MTNNVVRITIDSTGITSTGKVNGATGAIGAMNFNAYGAYIGNTGADVNARMRITETQNNDMGIVVQNAATGATGTTARASINLANDNADTLTMAITSTGFTPLGLSVAAGASVISTGAGGLTIGAATGGTTIVAANAKTAHVTSLGMGLWITPNYDFHIERSVTGAMWNYIKNTNNGNSSNASFLAVNDLGHFITIGQMSSTNTAVAGGLANNNDLAVIQATNSTGGLLIGTTVSASTYIMTNNVVRITIDSTGITSTGTCQAASFNTGGTAWKFGGYTFSTPPPTNSYITMNVGGQAVTVPCYS